ncbi:acyl-CoA dehydrogenase [Nocardia stercoris]|uniref:Broad-specificity linear acyl-CoA dehydrogenase FadE5 n=1 Tax=Nocardia stercoris TaxID=2483361 RepID=A0A3M2L501_9NOCA|nr:acyl-CoA dehydrogenase [Nocardia stercoris]RMI32727.1 acyl-CoA dehydrogenase [Nocardia stercoris]
MAHYIANVRDIEFNLFEVLNLRTVLDSGAFGDLDCDTARSMLSEAAKLAEGPLAETFATSDRNPPEFIAAEHRVTVPPALASSVQAVKDAQWWQVGVAEGIGGISAPAVLTWAINEILYSANPSAAFFYSLGPALANALYAVGNDQQKHWAAKSLERGWSGTMVLTEPDAGSDVGAGITKAVQQADGTWHIDGIKRFISGGDVGDTAENIFHLVLARPEGAQPGTKGLSLFYVPNHLFDPVTLELRERNGVFVTGVEHKMGLKASPTCEISFGRNGVPAVGYLVGDVHNGIAQMFKVIEHARMVVGVKSAGTLSTGYLNALAYAKTRIQGTDPTRVADPNAPRVPIIAHPDVRRSLMTQKAYAEGLRAVYLYTAAHQDPEVAHHVSGADADLAHHLHDLLLPIVKGVGSERAYQLLTESLQTFGGSGVLQDYPIEQYIRDAKIDSLYEGTTAIQALDFFFRKIIRNNGVALTHLSEQIARTVADGGDRLKAERELLRTALDDVQVMTVSLTGFLIAAQREPEEAYKVGLGSVRYLLAMGDLLIGWRLLVQAEIAAAALRTAEPQDRPFYQGKVAVASHFAKNALPLLTATRRIIESLDADVMAVDEAAF